VKAMGADVFEVPRPIKPPPGRQARFGRAVQVFLRNRGTQRGEAVTCRDRKSRKNAEGHANAEPQNYI